MALELPDEVRGALVGWRGEVAAQAPRGLRLVRPEDLHVTLCFLGWRPVAEVPSILEACQSAAAGKPATALQVDQGIWLPPRRPRLLAVELTDVDAALGEVQSALSDALAAGSWYQPERRPFLAHVTVARVPERAGRLRAFELRSPPALRFEGSRVTLYRSRLSAAGARYEPLGGVTLG